MRLRKAISLSLVLLAAASLGAGATVPQKSSKKPAVPASPNARIPASARKRTAPAKKSKSTFVAGKSHRTSKASASASKRQPGQKVPAADRVTEIQEALGKDGFLATEPNGKWDQSTVEAMKKFQAAHGLNPSGRLEARTLQKLGLGSPTAGVAAPMPPAGSVSRLAASSQPDRRQ